MEYIFMSSEQNPRFKTPLPNNTILHPAKGARFSLDFIKNSVSLSTLRLQTLSYTYDIANKTIEVILEIPQHSGSVERELEFFCSPSALGNFIVINYLDGNTIIPDRTVHCRLNSIISCTVTNDYAVSDTTCKVILKCGVGSFIISNSDPIEDDFVEFTFVEK